jgi:hypothetical protein
MKKTYKVIRSDGRDVLRYSFTNKREAEKAASGLKDPAGPFTYKVVAYEK